MPVNKPIGSAATFTAVVTNAEGVVLPDAVVTWSDDSATDAPVVDPTDKQVATVTGSVIETVTVTASVEGASGPITGTDTVSFSDNTPSAVTVTAS